MDNTLELFETLSSPVQEICIILHKNFLLHTHSIYFIIFKGLLFKTRERQMLCSGKVHSNLQGKVIQVDSWMTLTSLENILHINTCTHSRSCSHSDTLRCLRKIQHLQNIEYWKTWRKHTILEIRSYKKEKII